MEMLNKENSSEQKSMLINDNNNEIDIEYDNLEKYNKVYPYSINHIDKFYEQRAKRLKFDKQYDKVLEVNENGTSIWFNGGKINPSYNLIEVNLEKFGNKEIMHFHDIHKNTKRILTLNQFFVLVKKYSNFLIDNGVKENDNILFFFPLQTLDVAIFFQACIRVGAAPLFVDSYVPVEDLIEKISVLKPRLLITASCKVNDDGSLFKFCDVLKNIYKLDELTGTEINSSFKLNLLDNMKVVVFQRSDYYIEKDIPFNFIEVDEEIINKYSEENEGVVRNTTDTICYLESSGSTGKQKILKYSVIGLLCTAIGEYMHIYKTIEKCFGHLGFHWVTGSTLHLKFLINCIEVHYFMGMPKNFYKTADELKIQALGGSTQTLKFMRGIDRNGDFIKSNKLENLKFFLAGGEVIDEDLETWITSALPQHVQFINGFGQTEFFDAGTTHLIGVKTTKGSSGFVVPGLNFVLKERDNDNVFYEKNRLGYLLIKTPLPPSFSSGLFGDDSKMEQFAKKYLVKIENDIYYSTDDLGIINDRNEFICYGREGDELKINIKKVSASKLEGLINNHPLIIDSLATEKEMGHVNGLFILIKGDKKLYNDVSLFEKTKLELTEIIKHYITEEKCLIYDFYLVNDIPKNINGKTLRGPIKSIANNKEPYISSTMINKGCIENIKKVYEEGELSRKKSKN